MHIKLPSTTHLLLKQEQLRSVYSSVYYFSVENNFTPHNKQGFNKARLLRDTAEIFNTSPYSSGINFSYSKLRKMENFCLSKYDCIGFDLDNTILRYKIGAIILLEYDILSKYLVSKKGYDPDYLLKPLEKDIDFIQKGLILDFYRGNILQLRCDGYIQRASHGTKFMSEHEIKKWYGPEQKWSITTEFCQNMLVAWNGPMSEMVRTTLDYFDMPAALIFARIVDSLDAKNGEILEKYNIWPDILESIVYMYDRDSFRRNEGEYFPALKANPEKYLHKCSSTVINWLKETKRNKLMFLVTGSNVDFASFTAEYCLGNDWRTFFDVVVCFARKPGFFTDQRPFIKLDGLNETHLVEGADLELGTIYSQGNWQELCELFRRKTGKVDVKCIYVGDNLIQDIYTPSKFTTCEAVAVMEELEAEKLLHILSDLPIDTKMLISKSWGSSFCNYLDDKSAKRSLWNEVIQNHAKICVPHLEALAKIPLEYGIPNSGHEKQEEYYTTSSEKMKDK